MKQEMPRRFAASWSCLWISTRLMPNRWQVRDGRPRKALQSTTGFCGFSLPGVSMNLSTWVHDPCILGNAPLLRVMEAPGTTCTSGESIVLRVLGATPPPFRWAERPRCRSRPIGRSEEELDPKNGSCLVGMPHQLPTNLLGALIGHGA